jgi:hypothetical protein
MSQKPERSKLPSQAEIDSQRQLGQNGPPPLRTAAVDQYGAHGGPPKNVRAAPANQVRPTAPAPPPPQK